MAFKPLPLLRVSPAIVAAFLASMLILLAPAIWNGFPILFYDSGDYFARVLDGVLNNGRSIVYGAVMTGLRYPYFWPLAILQCALTAWTIYLVLRTHGLGQRPVALPLALVGIVAALSALTALAWVASMMMPDLFAALGVLALYLLLRKRDELGRFERYGLVALIAFSAAGHNATLAVVVALLAAAVALHWWRRTLIPRAGLKQAACAVVITALLVPSAGYIFAGNFAWTPGGAGFIFSRLVQDGIAQRYLADNCPDPKLKLCEVRHALPDKADDFLWHQGERGPFAHIGGFEGGADEMKRIAIDSLVQYPLRHLATAFTSTLEQLVSVGTGDGVVHDIGYTYGVLEDKAPEMTLAIAASQQKRGKLEPLFEKLNDVHEPVTLGAIAFLPLLLLLAWRRGAMRDTDWLAATVILALFANAFVTGVLSNPHDRYGARLAWTAPLVWSVVFAHFLTTSSIWRERLARAFAAMAVAPKAAPIEVSPRKNER
ncbi:MAG: hypothetical protein KF826_04620 [Xanthobacteraceae bacterium]|nr:hypothetical protein [Xanthobacteraceae bacterium]MCW5679224.1 hypothetical protein [Xanthobacteraceae bacterium]